MINFILFIFLIIYFPFACARKKESQSITGATNKRKQLRYTAGTKYLNFTKRQPNYYGRLALEHGRNYLEKNEVNTTRNGYLCSTFLSTDVTRDTYKGLLKILTNNTKILDCDWLILFYKNNNSYRYKKICKTVINGISLPGRSVLYCGNSSYLTNSTSFIQQHITPHTNLIFNSYNYSTSKTYTRIVKPILYMDILPYLSQYKRVLLLDSDMDFYLFNFTYAMKLWDCSMQNPPLIVQPVVYGEAANKQMRYRHWGYGNTNVDIHYYPNIEQQVPFVDSIFFEWFLRYIVQNYTLPYYILKGSDFGIDTLWCGAANDYAIYVLDRNSSYNNPCAILIGSGPVIHINTKTLKTDLQFRRNGQFLINITLNYFESWFFRKHYVHNFHKSIYKKNSTDYCYDNKIDTNLG